MKLLIATSMVFFSVAALPAFADQDLLVTCSLDKGGALSIYSTPGSGGKNIQIGFDQQAIANFPRTISLPSSYSGWLDTSDSDNGIIGMGFDGESTSDASSFVDSLGNYSLPPAGASDFDGGVLNLTRVKPDFKISELRPLRPAFSIYIGMKKKRPLNADGSVNPGGQDRAVDGVKKASMTIGLSLSWPANVGSQSASAQIEGLTLNQCFVGPKIAGRISALSTQGYLNK